MTERKSAEYYQALEGRLKPLLPELQATISLENWRWFEEWVRAGEYGLALEVAAEGLSALEETPQELAREILSTAKAMDLKTAPIARLRTKVSEPDQ